MQADAKSQPETPWTRRYGVVFRARLSALYHLKRERHYEWIDKSASALTAIAATSAAAAVLRQAPTIEPYLAIITAVLSLIPLVFSPAQKARHHAHLAAEFRRILTDCERAGLVWADDRCADFAARILALEESEPAPMAGVIADCQNQLALAAGDGPVAKINWLQRWFVIPWFDVRPDPTPEAQKPQLEG